MSEDLKEKILDKISSKDTKMRSRMSYVLQTVVFGLLVVLLITFLVFLISLVIFSTRASGAILLPSFGLFGFPIFFRALPWLLIIITGLLIVLLEVLLKKYSLSYKHPLVYSFLAVVLGVGALAMAVDQTPIHSNLHERAMRGELPIADRFYKQMKPVDGDVHFGIIESIEDGMWTISTLDDDLLEVVLTEGVRVPEETVFEVGDEVIVIGPEVDEQVQVTGIHPLERERVFMPHPMRHMMIQGERLK